MAIICTVYCRGLGTEVLAELRDLENTIAQALLTEVFKMRLENTCPPWFFVHVIDLGVGRGDPFCYVSMNGLPGKIYRYGENCKIGHCCLKKLFFDTLERVIVVGSKVLLKVDLLFDEPLPAGERDFAWLISGTRTRTKSEGE